MGKVRFLKTVTPKDWSALPRKFKQGEEIWEFFGCNYGCVADDFRFGGRVTMACSLGKNKNPFFTVPVEFLDRVE